MLPLPAGREASPGSGAFRYARHRPEGTLLYQIVETYYPTFVPHLAARGTILPGYVQREFEDYLCPSCGARRMAESAALLVDEVLPPEPMRQWVLSVPFPLRFLFASRPEIMGQELGIVYRTLATHLVKKAERTHKTAHTGAVTLIQRFGSALNLNIHFHMLFLDGVYVERSDGSVRFRWVKAPTSAELNHLTHTLAHRIGRFLERQGLLERDVESSYLASDGMEEDSMNQLLGHSITSATAPALLYLLHYPCSRTASPWARSKGARCSPKAPTVGTLQTLPACDEPFDEPVGRVAGFSLAQATFSPRPGSHLVHAGVAAKVQERKKLERLCRYIARPAVSEKRLSLTPNGNVRYQLKTPYRDGTTHVIFEYIST